MTTPPALRELRASATSAGVVLQWLPGEEADRLPARRWFIVRLRIDAHGGTTLEKTRFVHASNRSYADIALAPGRYRYYVGGLNDAGSGPHTIVEIAVHETAANAPFVGAPG